MAKRKKKWDWALWLDALEKAGISDKAKALGREIPPVMRRTSRALVPWELPGLPGYNDLAPLVFAGLLHQVPAVGQFVPALDPLPSKDAIKISPGMRRIIRLLLAGGDFYLTDPGSRYDRPGWRMRRDWNGPTIKIDQRCAHALLKLGLLEWDGCGNWPVFDHRRYRVNMRQLHGVKGFAAASERWIKERIQRAA